MIDIHSHFLPDIDDGAKNINESIEMLTEAFAQGINVCAATPHCIIHDEKDIGIFLEKREAAYKQICDKLAKSRYKVPKLIMGAEVYLDNNINQYHEIKNLCIENTNLMLIEFPVKKGFPKYAEEWIYDLNYKGIIPIIAHIDRYPYWKEAIKVLSELNVHYQINASKFLTISGRKLIRKIMKFNNSYIVSSDMHNTHTRKCNIRPAYEKALKMYKDRANALFENNAQKILNL